MKSGAGRGDMTEGSSAIATEAKAVAEALERITSLLNDEERALFGVELLDAARHPNAVELTRLINDWAMTAFIRTHPQFEPQTKEYLNLVQSGELFSGTDLSGDAD